MAPVLPHTVPTAPGVERLEPEEVYLRLLSGPGCILVDVRGADRSAGLIEGALHVPVIDPAMPFTAKVPQLVQQFKTQGLVVFTCQYSAHRAPQAANWYRAQAPPWQRVAILAGGFRAWEGKGLPVQAPAASAQQAQAADEYAKAQGIRFAAQRAGMGPPAAVAPYPGGHYKC